MEPLVEALVEALITPLACIQGFLLPLCAAGDCSLREAVIVSAVLRRVSLPVLHSAAALLRIADMEYSGTNSFFISVRNLHLWFTFWVPFTTL